MMNRDGVTITSVLVAAALAGIISAVVAQLISNQTKVMRSLTLREERESLLKHYRNALITGWDNTLAAGCSSLRDRDNRHVIAGNRITSKSDNLYPSGGVSDPDGWWEVSFSCGSKSGSIFGGDKYEKTSGSGMHSETHQEVTLTVKFLQKKHAEQLYTAPKLKDRVEKFYMHQQKRRKSDATDCTDENNHTRRNSYKPDIDAVPASLFGGSRPDSFPLYKGTGAVIQYDFNTNYVKCSQVPLVRPPDDLCEYDAAIIGFWGLMEGGTGFPYVDGKYVCSHDGGTGTPPINPATGVRYHPRVDDKLPERYITVYHGDDGDPRHLGHFGAGCLKDSDANNHTYVSFIDGKGTAFCQRTRHVVESDITCGDPYPHPLIAEPLRGALALDPTDNITHPEWGEYRGDWDKPYAYNEIRFETDLRAEVAASPCRAKGWCPPLPATKTGIFSRDKQDTCWKLGRGGMREFYRFDDARGDPGKFHDNEADGYECAFPGHEKGAPGTPGPIGNNGHGERGEWGDPGCITFSP